MKQVLIHFGLGLILLSCSPPVWAQQLDVPLAKWKGELLQQGYGAFYAKVKLKGFAKDTRTRNTTTNVFLHFYDDRLKKRYVASQAVDDDSHELEIWKIPAGNYLLYKASFNDNNGRVRTWTSPGKPSIGIRHLFISNLGLLSFSALGSKGLNLTLSPQINSFTNTFKHDAFAGVIDGFSMKVQETLGGRELFSEAAKDYGSSQEVRAAFSQRREIAMFYKVDLQGNDRAAPKISSTVAAQDSDLRRCYTEELEKDGSLQGTVIFNFKIAQSDGTMRKIFYRGGNLQSPRVIQCLYHSLGKMQFPIAAQINGNITFNFSYRDETGRNAP